jgi:hypothetical protein
MITLEDCVALCGLTEAQVFAIAEHEHLPEIGATALAQYLSKKEHGMEKIRDMIVDDIRQSQQRQDKARVLKSAIESQMGNTINEKDPSRWSPARRSWRSSVRWLPLKR